MDYNDFEFVAFWMMSVTPGILLLLTGIIAHKRWSPGWIPGYLVVGILACFIYAMLAAPVSLQLFPPPYVPGLSEGRGLDLRGAGFVIGAWIGAMAGVAFALMTAAGSATIHRCKAARSRVVE